MSTLTRNREAAPSTVLVPRVNLLPPEIAEQSRFAHLQRLSGFILAAVVAVVALLALVVNLQVSSARNELVAAQATGTSLQNQVSQFTDVPKIYSDVAAAQSQLATAMGNEVRWSTYLTSLSLTIPSNVGLTSLTIRQDPANPYTSALGNSGIASVTYEGQAANNKNVATFLDSLSKQKGFIDPYLTSASKSTSETAKNLVTFSASATITDAAQSGRFSAKAGK